MISLDGITWTFGDAAEANFWSSVTYGNGLFVAVAQCVDSLYSIATSQVMTSS